jgi:hypothetical protein
MRHPVVVALLLRGQVVVSTQTALVRTHGYLIGSAGLVHGLDSQQGHVCLKLVDEHFLATLLTLLRGLYHIAIYDDKPSAGQSIWSGHEITSFQAIIPAPALGVNIMG